MRKTKIVCTIGPACADEETLTGLCQAGMNVARLNFSHGTHEEHRQKIELIKRVREKLGLPIAIMLDTKGPEYRIRTFKNGKIEVREGDTFTFTTRQEEGDEHHVSIAEIPGMYERTIVVNGFSKAYSMTGWRMGYLCGPRELVSQIIKLHQYGIMSAPTMSQYAAIEAMQYGDEDIAAMREEYDGRRRFLLDGFRSIGLECFEPKGAFYMFPSIQSTGMDSDTFCTKFLETEHVAVIPGSAFGPGGEGFFRACYAASIHDLSTALERMEHFIKHR